MKLRKVRIKTFRNILDSESVEIEPDVTCLVGKNESGKSAFLQALHRLHPAQDNVAFNVPKDYPAWLEKKHRREGKDIDKASPVEAIFELDDSEKTFFDKKYGEGALDSSITIKFSRDYENKFMVKFNIDEEKVIQNLITNLGIQKDSSADLKKIKTFQELDQFIKQQKQSGEYQDEGGELHLRIDQLEKKYKLFLGKKKLRGRINQDLTAHMPIFFYFSEYSTLPASVNIAELLEADKKTLNENESTARSLLEMAGAAKDYLLNPNYERRKRELENVANALTQDVLIYWSTNKELRVEIDITQKNTKTADGTQSVIDQLKIRMRDNRHNLSISFDERSSGFKWFFSFLAAFSEYEHSNKPVIILLDEPGLGLHAKAQKDFLKFIDEKLSKRCQVIYTTHSPFLVQPNKLERVRLIEEREANEGSKITQNILSIDQDTLFPLQGALGYDLVQHLLIAKNNLIVEGISDFTYLKTLSDHIKEQGKEGLNDKWSIVPVGGIDMIPAFVALLGGNHLDITVLVDSQSAGHQKLSTLAEKGYLSETGLITIGEILGKRLADIEDLFSVDDYLNLYNLAFGKELKREALNGSDSIVSKISRIYKKENNTFNHGKPAYYLLRNRDTILPKLSDESINNFVKLFERINKTFKDN